VFLLLGEMYGLVVGWVGGGSKCTRLCPVVNRGHTEVAEIIVGKSLSVVAGESMRPKRSRCFASKSFIEGRPWPSGYDH